MFLFYISDPYDEDKHLKGSGILIDIDLNQSAYGNAQK